MPTRAPERTALGAGLCVAFAALAFADKPPAADDESGPLATKTAPVALESGSQSPEPDRPAPAAPLPDGGVPPSALPAVPSGTPAEKEKWLAARIDEILTRPQLGAAKVGVAVSEIDGGRVLYARNDKTLFNPASNAKLFTTAAALGLLGPEYRFKTSLHAVTVKNGEVQGDLYLRGTGDPSLTVEDLWKMVGDLFASGVRRVTGNIAVDDTYFDEVRVGPAFEQKEEDYAFRAPAGAASINYNACTIHVMPAPKEGDHPRVVIEPASPYFNVSNQARTVPSTTKGRNDISIASKEMEGHTEIVVTGRIKSGSGEIVEHRRIIHPDLNAGHSLRELLGRRGIKVGGNQVVRAPVPLAARQLAWHASPPLGVIVRETNKQSNNFMAEQLLKTLGAEKVGKPGTWPKGVQAVASFLEGIGIGAGKYKLVNGSGLYDANRFSAAQVVSLLSSVYRDFRVAADFVGSLAVAGTDGTTVHRMEKSVAERYVRAKTGTLNGVSCLSGYAGAPGRVPLAFSILMNEVPDTGTQDARRAQDAIAEALVAFLSAN